MIYQGGKAKQTKTKLDLYASVSRCSSVIRKDRLTSEEQLKVALLLVSSKDIPAGPLSVSHHHMIVTCLPTNTYNICSCMHINIWERGPYQHRIWPNFSV